MKREKRAEIEKLQNTNVAGRHNKIKQIVESKTCSSVGSIISKENEIILLSWNKYIGELFRDSRG